MKSDCDHISAADGNQTPARPCDPAETAAPAAAHEPAPPVAPGPGTVVPATERSAIAPRLPLAPRPDAAASQERSQVHVPSDLHDLIAELPITPEEAIEFRQREQLNEIIHGVLTAGLVAGTVVMLMGLALDLVLNRALSTKIPRIGELVAQLKTLRPAALLALGLLILIATPFLRVLGSFAAFIRERDWRYAGITFLVLLILLGGLISGRG